MAKRTFCVVIPAFNEEKVIASSLRSMKKIFKTQDIYVVSDGSKDKTVSIARSKGVNVMALRQNGGKAVALRKLITSRNLTERYRYVLFSDADSRLDQNFLLEIKKVIKLKPALAVGTVISDKKGLISAFRTYEYGVTHLVYKNAQNGIKTITVAPGCASLYRSDALTKLDLSGRTMTEDFDLTIQIHQKKLGDVIYAPKALVVTQDPMTIRDYWRQIVRWDTGTWQNIVEHKLYKPNNKFNLEMYFLTIDNFLWLATIIFTILHPNLFPLFLLSTILTIAVFATLIAFLQRKLWILLYCPLFPLFIFLNISAYYYSLSRVLFSDRKSFLWQKVKRYSA